MARYDILSFFLLHAKITFMCTQKTNSMAGIKIFFMDKGAIGCRVVKLKKCSLQEKKVKIR